MAWVRIDDSFSEHPKVSAVGLEATALYVFGLCYANRNLTDGFIPGARLVNLTSLTDRRAKTLADKLVQAGLWELVDGGSYRIHDYLDYQPSRKEVDAEKEEKHEIKVKAGRAGAAKRWHSNGRGPSR